MKKLFWLILIAALASGWIYMKSNLDTMDQNPAPVLCGPDDPAPPPPPPPK